jgi:hypothetical protein
VIKARKVRRLLTISSEQVFSKMRKILGIAGKLHRFRKQSWCIGAEVLEDAWVHP